MRNVLAADASKKHIAYGQHGDLFEAGLPVVHIHCAVQNSKNLFAVIHMPYIGFIGPMQAYRRAVHIGDFDRAPCLRRSEFLTSDQFHQCQARKR